MKNFSLNRVGLMLRADWCEFKSYILWGSSAIYATILAIFLYNNENINKDVYKATFIFLLLGAIVSSHIYAHYKVGSSKGLGLLIPCSAAEKFIAILIGMSLIQVSALLFFYLSSFSFYYLNAGITKDTVPNVLADFNKFYFLMNSAFLLGIVSFRKKAILKTTLILAATLFLLQNLLGETFLNYLLKSPGGFGLTYYNTYSISFETRYLKHCAEMIYPPGIMGIAANFIYILTVVYSLLLLYISYLKIKEKEL